MGSSGGVGEASQTTERILAMSNQLTSTGTTTGVTATGLVPLSKDKLPGFPMTPRAAILHYSRYLSEFEKTEILEYDQIYYLNLLETGSGSQRKK